VAVSLHHWTSSALGSPEWGWSGPIDADRSIARHPSDQRPLPAEELLAQPQSRRADRGAPGTIAVRVSPLNRISLNVIVFNEEARLEACLSDARNYVDEIVVVDQMSTDGTPEIAQRLADVYIQDVHHGHAEPSRELAAARSSGEWILILDADEKMSDLLKAELRDLVAGEADGYWIRKVNTVDGAEVGTVLHYRLVRTTRVRFDPRPHGGAVAVSDNFEYYNRIGIVHEKTEAEQLYDDARYEQIALEDAGPTSAKRNWLSHNHALREVREHRRRTDLEALVPNGAARVLVVGDVSVEPPGCTLVRVDRADAAHPVQAGATTADQAAFDAAILGPLGDDLLATVRTVADLVRPGGVIIGTAPAARNRRSIEETIEAVVSDGRRLDTRLGGSATRQGLSASLAAMGLDVRWLRLVRDGWLDPLAVRPDGSGSIVESKDFLLRSVPADVAEELTAEEIVFAAVRPSEIKVPACSIILVALPGADPQRFLDALGDTPPEHDREIVVVQSEHHEQPVAGARPVLVPQDARLAARWNAGARAAAGDLLVFVSTDSVPEPGWLDALVQAHRSRPDTGAVGSKVIATDGTIEHAGFVLGADRIPYRLYQGHAATTPRVNRPRIMPAVAAEGMATSRTRFVEVGGFDETLGEDLTDADFCLRLRTRGLPIIYSPAAVLRSSLRSIPGTRGDFRRSAREFATRWSRFTDRSEEVVCRSDGTNEHSEGSRSWRLPRPAVPRLGGLPAISWTSHFLEQGGYTEEAGAAIEALDDAGLYVVANPVRWEGKGLPQPTEKSERLTAFLERDLPDNFVHVAHIGADRFRRHPAAIRNIGRTMFETDGLPTVWRDRCNLMDEIWVPSEHNLRYFAEAGVDAAKLHKVPETYDTALFQPDVAPLEIEGLQGFVFLSVFSWIGRKAWDVLLRAWYDEFGSQDDVTLLLKTDTALAPPGTDTAQEVEAFVRGQLKRNPKKGARVVVLDQPLAATDVPRLYRAADAFVLASHGEGWGRPYMEAMAMGLPTIATGWSGNLEFMNDDNSYLVGYKLVDTPPDSWLKGQRWAAPSVGDLRRTMRKVYEHQSGAAAIGKRARADVVVSCRPELVAEAVRERLVEIDRHPIHVSLPNQEVSDQLAASNLRRRRTQDRPRITACVVVHESAPSLLQCLFSLRDLADEIIVVDAEPDADMASVRNAALDQVTGGWVIMVDATHTIDPASHDLVRELVEQDQFVGYAGRELHQFGLDGAVSAVELRTAFLFPHHPGLRYVGRVSEQLLPQCPDLEFRMAPSQVILHQHSAGAISRDPVARARRNLLQLERSVREAPDEPFHLYNLGIALRHLGLHVEAESTLRQAVELAPSQALWGAPAYSALSLAVAAQGRLSEAVKLGKAATKWAPEWAQGWCVLGEVLIDDGRLKAALRAYERALDCGDESWLAPDIPDETVWQAQAGMGRIHIACEQYEEAAECLTGALVLAPWNAELHVQLARAYEAVGRLGDARRHLERAVTVARTAPEAHLAFGDFFLRQAEASLVRGLADNTESSALLERIEKLRAARAIR
jgi:glycosyltransferase involved in cell wall biosynthesis/GT2 family glycosyltransferase/cytochrome c-type biogenesis protein CcmH/NrfG